MKYKFSQIYRKSLVVLFYVSFISLLSCSDSKEIEEIESSSDPIRIAAGLEEYNDTRFYLEPGPINEGIYAYSIIAMWVCSITLRNTLSISLLSFLLGEPFARGVLSRMNTMHASALERTTAIPQS